MIAVRSHVKNNVVTIASADLGNSSGMGPDEITEYIVTPNVPKAMVNKT